MRPIIQSNGLISAGVETYNDLPSAVENDGKYYIVYTNTSLSKLIGGDNSGVYRSNGSTWIKLNALDRISSLSKVDDRLVFTNELGNTNEISLAIDILWNDIVVDGRYIQDLGGGKHEYTKSGVTYYRLVTLSPYSDVIYSDIACTNEITRRG